MKTFTLSFLAFAPAVLAQCEAPVPCQDESLNRLNTTDCQTYHSFIARGSDSGYPGHLGPLAKLVCEQLTSSDSSATCGYENIVYPANSSYSGSDTIWCESAALGAKNGQAQMKEYAERCPDAKLVLLGYSQGGSVAMDILGGGGGDIYKCTQPENPPLDPKTSPGSHIVAAAIFGSVHRSAHQSYTFKNGGENYDGETERDAKQLAALNKYASVMREYCQEGDPICAPESAFKDYATNKEHFDIAQKTHLSYFEKYNDDAAKFIVARATKGPLKDNSTVSTKGSADPSSSVQTDDKEEDGEKGAAAMTSARDSLMGLWVLAAVAMMVL